MNPNQNLPLHTTHGTMNLCGLGIWIAFDGSKTGRKVGTGNVCGGRGYGWLENHTPAIGAVVTDEMVALPQPAAVLGPVVALTPASLALFIEFAKDACNYSGTPEVGGNVHMNAARRGNLTDLKKQGLVRTFTVPYDGPEIWLEFTPRGVAYAKFLGLDTFAFDYAANIKTNA